MRAIVVALASAVALAAVAGCGGDDGDDEGTQAGGTSTQASTKAPTGEFTVWHYYDEGAGGLYNKLPVWKQAVESKFPGVTVKYQYVPYDQLTSKVTAAAAAGKGPDIVMPTAPFMPEMIKAGALEPMDDCWGSFADKDQFPAQVTDSLKSEGQLYGAQAFANVVGLFYNKKILDEIGVEPPQNLDDLEAAMAKAKAAGHNAMTVDAPPGAGGEFNLVPWMASAGWTYDDPTNQGGLDAVKRIGGWVDQGYINEADAGGFNSATNFTTGKYAFTLAGNWNLGSFEDSLKFDYGVATPEGIDKAVIGGEALSIGANAEDKDGACKVIQEMFLTKQAGLEAADAGSIPLRQDVAVDPAVKSDDYLSTFATIASNSIGLPLRDNSGKISNVLGGAYNQLVAGKLDGQQAADKIAEELPPLMQEQ